MRINHKLTEKQIKKLLDLATSQSLKDGKVGFNIYIDPTDKNKLIVKMINYKLLPDNSIDTEIVVSEINENGKMSSQGFKGMSAMSKIEYLCQLIEIDVVENGKVKLI